jgi:hypothetical protein
MTEGAATVRYCIYTIMLCDECRARGRGMSIRKADALGGIGGTDAAPIAYTLRGGMRMCGHFGGRSAASAAPIRALL